MSPEELLQFLRGQAQGLMAGDQPAKAPRRSPTPSVLPVDVTGRSEPDLFFRDAHGNVVRAPRQPEPATRHMQMEPVVFDAGTPAPPEPTTRHIQMEPFVFGAPTPAPPEPESGYVREPEAAQNDLALNPRHTADSRAASERLTRIMQQLPSNTRTRRRSPAPPPRAIDSPSQRAIDSLLSLLEH